MKAVILASLLCVSTVALGVDLPVGFGQGLESVQEHLQGLINTPLSRDFKPSATAVCPWSCTETEFLLPALQALQYCTAAQTALKTGIQTATNASMIDSTWGTFCGSQCYTAAQTIDPKYYCCLGSLGGPFFGMKKGCSKNAATNRFCGAELLNLGGISCTGTTSGNCVASGLSCEWDSSASRCAFKPTTTVLNSMCTTCLSDYINTFPGGGIDTVFSRNQMIAAYTSWCTKIQGQYCAITGGYNYNFRAADYLTNSELTTLCSDSSDNVKVRLCYKQVQASIASGLRTSIQGSYATCISRTGSASGCMAAAGGTSAAAVALDRMTSMMCANYSAGSYCFSLEKRLPLYGGCAATVMAGGVCNASCAAEINATVASAGCCMGVYAISGEIATASLSSQMRLMADGRALTLAGLVNRSDSTIPTLPPATFEQVASMAVNLVPLSPFNLFQSNCSGISLMNYFNPTGMCFNATKPPTITIKIMLNASYAALNADSMTAKDRIKADLANNFGIPAAAIVSIDFSVSATRTISANESIGVAAADVTVVVRLQSKAEGDMLKLEIAAKIAESTFSLPLTASELALNAPQSLSTSYAPIVASSTATVTVNDDSGSPPGGKNGASTHALLISMATVLMTAVVAFAL